MLLPLLRAATVTLSRAFTAQERGQGVMPLLKQLSDWKHGVLLAFPHLRVYYSSVSSLVRKQIAHSIKLSSLPFPKAQFVAVCAMHRYHQNQT